MTIGAPGSHDVVSEVSEGARAATIILAGGLASMRCRTCYRRGRPRDAMHQLRLLHEALLHLTGMQLGAEHSRSTEALRRMASRHAAVLNERLGRRREPTTVACSSATVRHAGAW